MIKACCMGLTILATVSAVAAESPSDAELIAALRRGGYVLYVRHPSTNPDQADTDPLHLDNVQAQRQLTDDGRAQAKALGAALREQKIPIERVLSSKFYRAQEAARLLKVGEVSTSVDVTEGGLVVSPKENKRRAAALKELLATPPSDGQNLVIVGHKPNLQDAAGKEFGDLEEAEVVVFQPQENGQFKLIARVPAKTWGAW